MARVASVVWTASAMHISHDGRSVYVSSEEGDSVAVFDREANGALANYGKLTFRQVLRDGVGGVDGLLGARGMAMDRDGRHLYVAGSFESTSRYSAAPQIAR
jgi:6-phosphogluconolactonase (cycloisomerase 2 family)